MSTAEIQQTMMDDLALPPGPVKRWTVHEYHQMLAQGLLQESAPYELIDGWIMPKQRKSPLHETVKSLLSNQFIMELPESWCSRVNCAITMSESEPEPDLAIIRGPQARYRKRHPIAEEVAIAIEVTDPITRVQDNGYRQTMYARAGIPTYWNIDLEDRTVEIKTKIEYRKHMLANYSRVQIFRAGKAIPVILDGEVALTIASEELFPS